MPIFASRSLIGIITHLSEASGRPFVNQTVNNTCAMPTVYCSRARAKAWLSSCHLGIAQTKREHPHTTIPLSNILLELESPYFRPSPTIWAKNLKGERSLNVGKRQSRSAVVTLNAKESK